MCIRDSSIAAALNVSPAASKIFLPSCLYLLANLPMVVVLPTPFTPTISIIAVSYTHLAAAIDIDLESPLIIGF